MQGWEIRVRGQVQGVGFRPFVWAVARRAGLVGHVLNDAEGVLIRIAGDEDACAQMQRALRAEAPALARVDAIELRRWSVPEPAPEGFDIAASGPAGAETRVTPDAATCADCHAEILDRGARRFRYPFTNCTNCGPRFTIITGLPYDRPNTTMAAFEMCPACRAEYQDPGDRRFHAQPIACPDCGPRAWAERGGEVLEGEAVALAAEALLGGEIVAIKGLGGFHLACDATNAEAVARLRTRKHRPTKPLALMAARAVLARHAAPSREEWSLLAEPAAPIVLLGRAGEALPEALAPGIDLLGWMLPYTPLHHLLCAAVDRPLVMTSANVSGAPQVIGNEEARTKLAMIADLFVMHDREIARRLDDSVERVLPSGPMVLRRARGRVPGTLPLPEGFADAGQVLALGGQMKAALCLTKNGQALLGHHLGELDEAETWAAWQAALSDYRELFDHRPEVVAVDLHPGYLATRAGEAMGLDLERVQHHHAHLAAVLGENGWPLDGGKVAGIVLDGLGLGADGSIWGGEVLLGDYRGFERAGYLRPAPLPGGDAANREPWRNLLARLDQAGLSELADRLVPAPARTVLRQAIAAGVNAPMSSSAGRLFDAFSAALGMAPARMSHEGEAAMRFEAAAARSTTQEAYPFAVSSCGEIDPAQMWQAWQADGAPKTPGAAARFHRGLANAFAEVARGLVESGRAEAVALSGGVMQNAVLLAHLIEALDGLPLLLHHAVPANDGGLALGQALVAAARRL
ncbi:MAG: carbamoyltransferase HypF [Alphaproteobacteria bacterium]|nr:MAG: carbamoyltransferase HypF [Alphaproteobacteria bacterium]